MTELEFDLVKKYRESKDLKGLVRYLKSASFGATSKDFLNHPMIEKFSKHKTDDADETVIRLCILIEKYGHALQGRYPSSGENEFKAVQLCLEEILQSDPYGHSPAKERGTAFLPLEIANTEFMKKLYDAEQRHPAASKLIALFMKDFPKPRVDSFQVGTAPPSLITSEKEAVNTLKAFLQMDREDREKIEKITLRAQRTFRGRKRERENVKRLMWYYDMDEEKAFAMLKDASSPYIPKCDPNLAAKIVNCAKKVTLFSLVNHLTSQEAITSIMNHGLLGRKTLNDFYMPFDPAALHPSDVDRGDLNVICLGAFSIDPSANHGIKMVFDAKKISDKNPCVFFKQRDFGFNVNDRLRKVKIGDVNISFSHTDSKPDIRCFNPKPENAEFYLLLPGVDYRYHYAYSSIPDALLISNNVENMHQILTLNFFRFIDSLRTFRGRYKPNSQTHPLSSDIYEALEKLSKEENGEEKLTDVLLDIGKKMSDTMEFNFYGSYQIDFTSLLEISSENPSFALKMKDFINDLNAGSIERLNSAKTNIPQLFNSYRFIDFLLETIHNNNVLLALQEQRRRCPVPSYMRPGNF